MAEDTKKGPQSLIDFAREQKLSECSVCRLPADIREQTVLGPKKRIERDTVLAWMRKAGWDGTDDDLTTHRNGHHDRKLRDLEANS